jgi:hypothetical protein
VLLVLLFLFLSPLLYAGKLIVIDCLERRVFGDGRFSVGDLADDCVAGQAEKQVLRVQLHGGELGETGIEVSLIEGLGVQLLVEPFFQAHGPDGFEVSGTRAEGEAVEDVQDAIIAPQLAGLIGLPGRSAVFSWIDRGGGCLSLRWRGWGDKTEAHDGG